jgi:hypothetical protein
MGRTRDLFCESDGLQIFMVLGVGIPQVLKLSGLQRAQLFGAKNPENVTTFLFRQIFSVNQTMTMGIYSLISSLQNRVPHLYNLIPRRNAEGTLTTISSIYHGVTAP